MFSLLVATATATAPTPAPPVPRNVPDVRAIFSADDFPQYFVALGVSRNVYTKITVRPDGGIQGCVAEYPSGDPKLDIHTCQLIIRRMKFHPATWADGSPVYGVIRVPISWAINNEPTSEEALLNAVVPDLELTVNQLPKGARSNVGVGLEIAADDQGRPVTCLEGTIRLRPDDRRHYPELVSIACQRVMSGVTLSPPIDVSGKPERSVQTFLVQFKVER